MKMYCIYDVKLEVYHTPFFCLYGEKELRRMLTSIVNTPGDVALHQFPEDFDVYELGSFDAEEGKLVCDMMKPNRLVLNLKEVKKHDE
nr:MAG: nonstructural protein [Microvirus sp.]